MSALSDAIAAIATGVTTLQASLTQVSTDLTAAIATLDAKIAAGGVSQADLDSLNTVNTNLQAASSALTAIDTTIKSAQ